MLYMSSISLFLALNISSNLKDKTLTKKKKKVIQISFPIVTQEYNILTYNV